MSGISEYGLFITHIVSSKKTTFLLLFEEAVFKIGK